jgi:hypothetical protein
MLPTFLRFADLRASGLVRNRAQLKNLIAKQGFPPGRLISANTRAWTLAEVTAYLDSRPVAPVVTAFQKAGGDQ